MIVPTIWKSYPFFTLTLLAAMQSIPGNLYEAAEVDGASAWQRFLHDHVAGHPRARRRWRWC